MLQRPVTQKHVYFIRHGETARNRMYVSQGPDEPLTERGREQARQLASFLKSAGIDCLISSDMRRARETAAVVAAELDMSYTIEPLVREVGWPARLDGVHYFMPASLRHTFDLYRHRSSLLWQHDGAENLALIRERIHDARLWLEALPGERIAVISHRVFMTMFSEAVCYDRGLSFYKFMRCLLGRGRVPNTGILQFSAESKPVVHTCTWRLEKMLIPPYTREIKS